MENKVEFLGSYGGDKEHAMSAWTSTSRDYEGKKERMPALLKMLAEAGHHCYDEKTEILTDNGWKYFDKLKKNDKVLAIDPVSLNGHFEVPSKIHCDFYDDEMYYVKGQQIDLAVTKHHRMFVSQRRLADNSDYGTRWEIQTSQEVSKQKRKYLKSCQIQNFDKIKNINFAKLIGFFIGDGHLESSKKISFHLKRKRKVKYLKSLGFDINIRSHDNYTVDISEEEFKIFKNCYNKNKEKIIPFDIFLLSKNDVLGLLDGLKNSDGSLENKQYNNPNNWSYYTNSYQLKEQLITLASINNFVFTERKPNTGENRKNPTYKLGYSNRISPEICSTGSRKIGKDYWKWYTGNVYCVTVSTGLVMVRRNGKTVISGNTPFEKSSLHFLVTTDIATHIHLLKHRISNLNAECLDGDTLVTFEDINGKAIKKKIRDLYESWEYGRKNQSSKKDADYSKKRIKNMRLRVMNEKTGKLETSNVKDIWKSKDKRVYKITLRNGKNIICSDNHPLYTESGYKSISSGLSTGDLVGCNGVKTRIKARPWTFPEFFDNAKNFTRKEFANKNNIKYELCKKWGYIFNIDFKKDDNKDFKKGNTPWNDGKAGTYSLNISEEGRIGRAAAIKRGEQSNFWRGGISTERQKIGSGKQIYYSDIVSINYVGVRECYDIEVEGKFKNFIANGIVTHNSARYKELKEDKEYLPEDWEGIKCSHFEYDGKDLTGAHWTQILKQHQKWSNALYHKAIEDLEGSLGRKRAKESARYFKLYSSQITADVMFNFRSFMHFQKLRNSNHSQVEIHNVAEQMLDLVKSIEGNPFKESLKGFGYE